jgi:hypothetical protein
MREKPGERQSGGVNISGTVGSVGGDIGGRDKVVGTLPAAALDAVLQPVVDAVKTGFCRDSWATTEHAYSRNESQFASA